MSALLNLKSDCPIIDVLKHPTSEKILTSKEEINEILT